MVGRDRSANVKVFIYIYIFKIQINPYLAEIAGMLHVFEKLLFTAVIPGFE